MKTSLTKLSSSFLLISLSCAAWAKPVAQVIEISGAVFMVTPDGKTSAMKKNQHLEDKAEVMVDEGATITLIDYYDATYHLTGGAHLKFFNKSVQLKKGKTWIQSMNSRHPLALTTANGHVNFWKGEFITTFDQATSRSQVLVVNGEVEVSNVLDQNMKYTVPAGSFTMVDPEIENGAPRSPTKVGLASLEKALSEFKQLPERLKAEPKASREIASVKEDAPKKKGQIIFIQSNRMPASVTSAHDYYKKMVNKQAQTAPVPIKFYGIGKMEPKASVTPRVPASIPANTSNVPKKDAAQVGNDPEFMDSLKSHAVEQPKFSKDLDSLMRDLNSL